MHLESVQIGVARPSTAARRGSTGIYKEPVDRALVTKAGVDGDVIVDIEVHGGPDQAVYVYGRDDYDTWADELDRPLPGGLFGENLTLSSLGARPTRVGDRYRIGELVLEVTSPRIPCATFQEKLGERDWVRRFRAAGRPGAYCRVLSEGEVTKGDPVERVPAPDSNLSLDELTELYFDRAPDAERLRAALASPVASRAREFLEGRLARKVDD